MQYYTYKKARVFGFGKHSEGRDSPDPLVRTRSGETGFIIPSCHRSLGVVSNRIRGSLKRGDMVTVRAVSPPIYGNHKYVVGLHDISEFDLAREVALDDPFSFSSTKAYVGRVSKRHPDSWEVLVFDARGEGHYGQMAMSTDGSDGGKIEGEFFKSVERSMLDWGRVFARRDMRDQHAWKLSPLKYFERSDYASVRGRPLCTRVEDGYVFDLPIYMLRSASGSVCVGGLLPGNADGVRSYESVFINGDCEPGTIAPPLRITERASVQRFGSCYVGRMNAAIE